MDELVKLLTALASFSWPAIIVWFGIAKRKQLSALIAIGIARLTEATEFQLGSLKFKAPSVGLRENPKSQGEVLKHTAGYATLIKASQAVFNRRKAYYKNNKDLMLVHTIKPTYPKDTYKGLRVFDVSVYLVPHNKGGKLNDVRQVTYYFGGGWGDGKLGSKYVITNGNNSFALSVETWGGNICIAEVLFIDGTKSEQARYLDVEMAPVYGIPISEARST